MFDLPGDALWGEQQQDRRQMRGLHNKANIKIYKCGAQLEIDFHN